MAGASEAQSNAAQHRGPQSAARVRALADAVAAARHAFDALPPADLTALTDTDLTELLTAVDELGGKSTVARAALVGEALSRRILASSHSDDTAWVARQCPTVATGGARQVLALSGVLADDALLPVADAVRALCLSPAAAITIAREYQGLRPRLADDAQATVLDHMVELGCAHGGRIIRQFRDHLLARYGRQGDFQDAQDTARTDTELSVPVCDNGVYRYALTLDPESPAVLEAAIGPLSAPQPGPDGTRDLRSVGQRRGQALVEICRRIASVPDLPGSAKTTLFVTMDYDQLAARVGAGVTIGSTATGVLLAPDTARTLACDAELIPAVLGSDGQMLDYGGRRDCSPARRSATCGCGTGTARSMVVRSPPNGATPTMWSIGQTAARPTPTTAPCSADATTRSSTATNSPDTSPTGTCCGTENPAPTNTNAPPNQPPRSPTLPSNHLRDPRLPGNRGSLNRPDSHGAAAADGGKREADGD